MFGAKITVWFILGACIAVGSGRYLAQDVERQQSLAGKQFDNTDASAQEVRMDARNRNDVYGAAIGCWLVIGVLFFTSDVYRLFTSDKTPNRNGEDDDRPLGARRKT